MATFGSINSSATYPGPGAGTYLESFSNTFATTPGLSNQFFDWTSLSLTAGSWDVYGIAEIRRNSVTFVSPLLGIGIGTVTGNDPTGLTIKTYAESQDVVPVLFTYYTFDTPLARLTPSVTTTYYLKGFQGAYSGSTTDSKYYMRALLIST